MYLWEVKTSQVRIKVFGGLYEYMPDLGDNDTIEVEDGSTLQDVLDELDFPDHAVWISTINGKKADRTAILVDGDTIEIFAPVGGG